MRARLVLLSLFSLLLLGLTPAWALVINDFEEPQELAQWSCTSSGTSSLNAQRSPLAAFQGDWGVRLNLQVGDSGHLTWERQFPIMEDLSGAKLVIKLKPVGRLPAGLAITVKTGYGDFSFGPVRLASDKWQAVKLDLKQLGLAAEVVSSISLRYVGSEEGQYTLFVDDIQAFFTGASKTAGFQETLIDDLENFRWKLDSRKQGEIGASRVLAAQGATGQCLQVDYQLLGPANDWTMASLSGRWDFSSAQEFSFSMKGDGSDIYFFIWFIDAAGHLAIYGPHGSNKNFRASNTDWKRFSLNLEKDQPASDNGVQWDKVTLIGFMINDTGASSVEARGTLYFDNLKLGTDPRALKMKAALQQILLPVEHEQL
jgi:hypothetical protein